MDASFEEKSVWITLGGLLLAFGWYFLVATRMLAAGVTESAVPYFPPMAAAIVALVIIVAVGHAAVVVAARPEGRDERDQLIGWRAEHNSAWLLGFGVIGAIFALATNIGRGWIANGLLLSLFLSEVLARSFQLYYYRRGI